MKYNLEEKSTEKEEIEYSSTVKERGRERAGPGASWEQARSKPGAAESGRERAGSGRERAGSELREWPGASQEQWKNKTQKQNWTVGARINKKSKHEQLERVNTEHMKNENAKNGKKVL